MNEEFTSEVVGEENSDRFNWFIARARRGYERKAQEALVLRITENRMKDAFGRVLVPSEKVTEMRAGRKVRVDRLLYPGYVLVEIRKPLGEEAARSEDGTTGVMEEQLWHLVRGSKHILGFVGTSRNEPTPLSPEEVARIVVSSSESEEVVQTRANALFSVGDTVRITEGPFEDFSGVIEDVFPARDRVRVGVTVFSRSTPVEVSFSQIVRE